MRLYRLLCAALMLFVMACSSGRKDEVLRIGLIRPSLNHLPLSYVLDSDPDLAKDEISVSYFSSGWELQEAMISGKVDLGIMPFSYAFNAVAKDYPLKILSFLERETDAVIAFEHNTDLKDLKGKKLGVLKASTLDLLANELSQRESLDMEIRYFRSPNEMIAALSRREVNGICLYEPLISKLDKKMKPLYYFAESYPDHPCCDIVINTRGMNQTKRQDIEDIMDALESVLANPQDPEYLSFAREFYKLSEDELRSALRYTGYQTGLDQAGIDFEYRMMQIALEMGYLSAVPAPEDIYHHD